MLQIVITKNDRDAATVGISEGENLTPLEAEFLFDLMTSIRKAEQEAIIWHEASGEEAQA